MIERTVPSTMAHLPQVVYQKPVRTWEEKEHRRVPTSQEVKRGMGTLHRVAWYAVAGSTICLKQEEIIHAEVVAALNRLYTLCQSGKSREAIAEALDYFDNLLIDRRFPECNLALQQLRETQLAPSVMVSILGITIRAKGRLNHREAFYRRALQEISRLKGKRYARELLTKYS